MLSFGSGIFSGIANAFILVALPVYLLLDGDRVFAWLTTTLFWPHRARARRIRDEVRKAVGGYVRGQLLTSLALGAHSFITLTVAGVPEPLLLAVLAALLDAIPLVGATIVTVPAVLLALTVSFLTAVVVLLQ